MKSARNLNMNPKPKRSKNGCETCRRRKVKCDEIHPSCSECARLRFSCRWSQGKRSSLKSCRRGYGPLKSRDDTWAPRPLVPKSYESTAPEECSVVTTAIASPLNSDWSDPTTVDIGTVADQWSQDLVDDMKLMFPSPLEDMFHFSDSSVVDSGQDFAELEKLFSHHQPSSEQTEDAAQDLFPIPSLSAFHMALPNSLVLSSKEHEALRHYQTTYSLYRTTKDPNWSTHKVLLHMGSTNTMIMHLLLAVSLNDYSLRGGSSSPSLEAETHFQVGAQLLIDASTASSKADNVNMMAAYFFIYLYMSKRKSTTSQRLSQLSLTVLNYVRKHDLTACCIRAIPASDQMDGKSMIAYHNRSILARLIMWTLDEDVKCSFQGAGGHLARYLAKRSAKTKEIYDASRNALGDHWGTEYPHSQMLDDDQNSTVLEFLWAMMSLWQDINDLSHTSEASDLEQRIEQRFILFEKKYSSVFRHSSEITKPRPRILVNADFDIVLFHALKIYYFRSTISDLAMETPPEVQNSLKTILTLIQRTFSSRGTELHDRLQWPLFLAGIETNDTIYREWIFSRLTSDRVAAALQQTLEAQAFAGRRLSISEVRKLLYDGAGISLAATSGAYLDDIPIV